MEENKHLMEDNMSTDRGLLTVVHGNAKTVEGQGDKTIVVNGLSVSYSDSGTGATPIIFIHGFPFDKSTWQPQIDFFKKTQRVIAYDIRGFGSSQAGKDPMNMSLFATDLVKFMDALEISTAIICGLSMGGYILLNAENRYRNRFKALVLCDTQCIADSPELKEKRNRAIAQIIAGRIEDFAFYFIKSVFCEETVTTKPELVERTRKIILSTQTDVITGGLNALAQRWDMCVSLDEISVPALIMCGREDTVTPPAESESLHKHIANSVLHIIDNAGHLSNLEQPDKFNRYLSEFIAGLTK